MSTYLLACSIGPWEGLEALDQRGRPIGVYTMPGKKEQGFFALQIAVKAINFYENYFLIDYPLKKLDMLAVPDFASGAMENWGLITYRESCLLVDDQNSSASRKQTVAICVTHEIAHQWFGNLVTMEWWTHLWLNEGFASFMEYLCFDHILPEYQIWEQFVSDSFLSALRLDALDSSHPIEVPVGHPDEIDQIFDIISYSKGASAIRMLYEYIGDADFRVGMNQYLRKFEYQNAVTEDLWDCLGEASNKPVREIMTGWVKQKGYPWLDVTCEFSGRDLTLHLSQSKFTASGEPILNGSSTGQDVETRWMIPISIIRGVDPSVRVVDTLMRDKEMTISLTNVGVDWIKFNFGCVCLYRVMYPPNLASKFHGPIRFKTMDPLDRLNLLSDFFAMCMAGRVLAGEFMEFLLYFKDEGNYTVWESIDESVGKLASLLADQDALNNFNAFACELYLPIFEKLGWDPRVAESPADKMLRALVVSRLVHLNHDTVIREAKRRFKLHMRGAEPLVADLRPAVYKAVAAHGDDEEFECLFTLYRASALHEEKNRVAVAIGSAKLTARLDRAVDLAISDEVRNQDKIFIFAAVGRSNVDYAWTFFQEKKDYILATYEGGRMISVIIKHSTEYFASFDKADEIDRYFKLNFFPGTQRTVQQSLETIRINAKWMAKSYDGLAAYLAN